jgi:hypothetical protein
MVVGSCKRDSQRCKPASIDCLIRDPTEPSSPRPASAEFDIMKNNVSK